MKKGFLLPLAIASVVFGTPTKMYVGTYSINNYQGNGSPATSNLNWSNDHAKNFYTKVNQYVKPKVPNTCL